MSSVPSPRVRIEERAVPVLRPQQNVREGSAHDGKRERREDVFGPAHLSVGIDAAEPEDRTFRSREPREASLEQQLHVSCEWHGKR